VRGTRLLHGDPAQPRRGLVHVDAATAPGAAPGAAPLLPGVPAEDGEVLQDGCDALAEEDDAAALAGRVEGGRVGGRLTLALGP